MMYKKRYKDLGNGRFKSEFVKGEEVLNFNKKERSLEWNSNLVDYNNNSYQVDELSLMRIGNAIQTLETMNSDIEYWEPILQADNFIYKIENSILFFGWKDYQNRIIYLNLDDFKKIQAIGVSKYGGTFNKFL